MANLDHEFELDGRRLVLRADIAAGWRKERRYVRKQEKPKTYYFSEVIRAEWQGGSIQTQLQVFPDPRSLDPIWERAPIFAAHAPTEAESSAGSISTLRHADGAIEYLGRVEDCCRIGITESGNLLAAIDLLDANMKPPLKLSLRRNKSGDWFFNRISYERVVDELFHRQCQIQLRLTFQPGQRPPPEYRSFWNEFLPGGRPESNRRRF